MSAEIPGGAARRGPSRSPRDLRPRPRRRRRRSPPTPARARRAREAGARSCAEADPRCRRPPDRLDQAVVAAAAADRALGADRLVLELERGARVVVEPANEGRLELVPDADGVEDVAYLLEVLSALVAEALADLRRIGEERLHLFALHVEDAERRRAALGARLFVELGVARRARPRASRCTRAGNFGSPIELR